MLRREFSSHSLQWNTGKSLWFFFSLFLYCLLSFIFQSRCSCESGNYVAAALASLISIYVIFFVVAMFTFSPEIEGRLWDWEIRWNLTEKKRVDFPVFFFSHKIRQIFFHHCSSDKLSCDVRFFFRIVHLFSHGFFHVIDMILELILCADCLFTLEIHIFCVKFAFYAIIVVFDWRALPFAFSWILRIIFVFTLFLAHFEFFLFPLRHFISNFIAKFLLIKI